MLVDFSPDNTGTYPDVEVASGSKASQVVGPDEGLHMMKLWAARCRSLKNQKQSVHKALLLSL